MKNGRDFRKESCSLAYDGDETSKCWVIHRAFFLPQCPYFT